MAMSNAQVATVADVTAGYWNPAGLLEITNDYEVSLMHAEYFAGIAKYDYAAFATKVDTVSHLGISMLRFAVDDIPDTRFLYDANGAIDYNNIRFFSAADYAFLLSYARKMPFLNGLKVGANFKVIYRNAGNFANAWGFGIDLGAQMAIKAWQFGLTIRDATGTFNAWSHNSDLVVDIFTQTGNVIPENSIEVTLPKATFGVGRLFSFGENFSLLAALDLNLSFDGKRNVLLKTDLVSVDPDFGLEVGYKQLVFARLGIGEYQQVKDFDGSQSGSFQPNFGMGVKVKMVNIDYALTDIGDQSESLYSHIFSLKFDINKSAE